MASFEDKIYFPFRVAGLYFLSLSCCLKAVRETKKPCLAKHRRAVHWYSISFALKHEQKALQLSQTMFEQAAESPELYCVSYMSELGAHVCKITAYQISHWCAYASLKAQYYDGKDIDRTQIRKAKQKCNALTDASSGFVRRFRNNFVYLSEVYGYDWSADVSAIASLHLNADLPRRTPELL